MRYPFCWKNIFILYVFIVLNTSVNDSKLTSITLTRNQQWILLSTFKAIIVKKQVLQLNNSCHKKKKKKNENENGKNNFSGAFQFRNITHNTSLFLM